MEARNPFTVYAVRRPTPTPIPELPHGCNSWVVTSPKGTVLELFERVNVEKAAAAGWSIKTARQHLADFAAAVRS